MPPRQASRVDGNQASIVRQLRAVGASILYCHTLKNCFDLLVGYRGRTFLIEVKDPAQPPSGRQLTPGEAKFKAEWRGSPYHIVESIDQALAIITSPEKLPETTPNS